MTLFNPPVPLFRWLTGMLLAASALVAGLVPAHAEEAYPITEAEKLLFMTDHLANLTPPAVLEYSYVRNGSLVSAVQDKATLELSGDRASKAARVDYLPGSGQAAEQPPISGVIGNPIILNFLERELSEMKRLTKGSTNYFRKRLRLALADKPELSAVTARYGDQTVPATRIRIVPYSDDPQRHRYEQYADKVFEFTLSDQVPGHVVMMHSELIKPAQNGEPSQTLISETLSLNRQVK